MNLPWIARSTYDAVASERDRLRDQVDTLIDSLTRIQRAESGLPEKPSEPKPRDPMPDDIWEEIDQWPEPHRTQLEEQAYHLYHKRGDWDRVRLKLLSEMPKEIHGVE